MVQRLRTAQQQFVYHPIYSQVMLMVLQIIRRQCSRLDDGREEAESLPAKHAELCRFKSVRDSGYRMLVGIIAKQVDSVINKVIT